MGFTLTYPEGAALVAGGTGHVGEGVTRCLARAGVPVVFTYRGNREKAGELEAALRAEGGKVRAIRMEMTDGASIDAALAAALEFGGGRLHTVAVAAGPLVRFLPIADMPEADLASYFDRDAMGVFRIFQRAVPLMRTASGGALVACATIANYRVVDFDGGSPFSKGAVEALVRQIAAEEIGAGIRCNAVGITWVFDLDVEEQIANLAGMPEPDYTNVQHVIRQMAAGTRIGRPATFEEAGNLFAFLASNEASFITGQTIRLAGGFDL